MIATASDKLLPGSAENLTQTWNTSKHISVQRCSEQMFCRSDLKALDCRQHRRRYCRADYHNLFEVLKWNIFSVIDRMLFEMKRRFTSRNMTSMKGTDAL